MDKLVNWKITRKDDSYMLTKPAIMNKKSMIDDKKKGMQIDPLSGKKKPKKFLTPSDMP